MANTLIQLKYSTVTALPTSLNIAEPAYSYVSNTLFIGTPDGTGVLNVGGLYYTEIIDNATNSNTASTLVLRDAQGSASFNVVTATTFDGSISNADTADKLTAPFDLGLSGDATGNVSVDGSANVTLVVDLTTTGVVAGVYGDASNIPVVTVGTDGRITNLANVAVQIPTTLNVAGDTGTTTVDLTDDTLTINGRDGVTTIGVSANNTVLIDVDNTVIRTSGGQTIDGNLTITGNLLVTGNTVTYDAETYRVNDPIVLYANNNTGNIVDVGFVAHYEDGGANTKHTGLVRHVSSNTWYLFEGYEPHVLEEGNVLDINDATLITSNLVANLTGGKVFDLTEVITVSDGGTGANTFASGQILIGNGTGELLSLANTGTAGTYANASHVPVISTDAYGRVSAVSNTPIAISASQVTSGTLPIARGGTNQTSFTANELIIFNGTALSSLPNTTYTLTGSLSASKTISSLTVDAYGRVTAATGTDIAIGASQITSGTLGVERGGTGATTLTTNGVLLGQGTSAITTASSSTEGHVLTINASGVPTFAMISGGTF